MTPASNGVVCLMALNFVDSGKAGKFVKIGDVKAPIRDAARPELVPIGYADKNAPPAIVSALKWLLQKDALQQDVFLIGVPGTLRTSVVLAYLELCNREFEYLAVTRDTTEADIKQRREIHNGSALYSDLCAVRAALHGRVLVIDGVEKAERNVLPILNNLLENREMQLDDGRFLMAAEKYDKLREKYSEAELSRMKLERVSENFHVIALGIPVPTFKGHTLDPPLRSRFQCRNLTELPFATMSELCHFFAPQVPRDKLNNLLALVYGLNSQKYEANSSVALPLFPTDMLVKAVRIWNQNPVAPEEKILKLCYPTETILKTDTQKPVLDEFIDKFGCTPEKTTKSPSDKLTQVSLNPAKHSADVEATLSGNPTTFTTPAGPFADGEGPATRHDYVSTPAHEALLADLALTHSVSDFALLGARGAGKTTIISELAHRLGYVPETVVLYQDMNSRELVQTRRMLPNGDTIWEDSQLVRAAKQGALCVLDGIEKVHWSTAEMLGSLIHHRYLQLPDGTRLIGALHYDALKTRTELTDEALAEKGIYKIADNFRLVALGDAESANGSRWLNEQLLSLFVFHSLKPMSIKEQTAVVADLVPGSDRAIVERLISLVERLRSSPDAGVRGVAASLSLRRLVYIIRRHTQNQKEGIYDAIHRATLARFMPGITRSAFEKALSEEGIGPDSLLPDTVEHDGWRERLSHADKTTSGNESMVPDIVFFDNKQHMKVMNDMAKDFELGSHLLVIGNQGVGKNKITDRFLQLIQRPRQYMQLHRDTTVQSLTVQSTVIDGILKHEDSPLVKAVREGLVLVVDEADKAPLYVVAVLKSLLDSGVLYLSDGRRIQPADMPVDPTIEAIPIHPDFRLIMLANRPGFPFLGNDLFAVLGDLFSVHVVDNPSRASELSMLRQYGPDVPQDKLDQLVGAFDELRGLSDGGLLSYPYSTRELVNIVKHLQLFPHDALAVVVRNVFDFDLYSAEATRTIEAVFHKHGIPIGIKDPEKRVYLSKQFDLKEIRTLGTWGVKSTVKPGVVNMQVAPVHAQSERELRRIRHSVEPQRPRQTSFNEQAWAWKLPISESNLCSDILDLGPVGFAVATVNPLSVVVVRDLVRGETFEVQLHSDLPSKINWHPRITLAPWANGFGNGILVHEEQSNNTFVIDLKKDVLQKLDLEAEKTAFGSMLDKFKPNSFDADQHHWRLVRDGERPVLFEKGGRTIKVLLPGELPAGVEILTLPEGTKLQNVLPISKDKLLLTNEDGPPSLLTFESDGRVLLRSVDMESPDAPKTFNLLQRIDTSGTDAVGQQFTLGSDDFYAVKSKNFPGLLSRSELQGWHRTSDSAGFVDSNIPYKGLLDKHALTHPQKETVAFSNGLVVKALANWEAPSKALPVGVDPRAISGFLEVVDTKKGTVQYVPVPQVEQKAYYHGSWIASISRPPFTIAKAADEKSLLTCDTGGNVRQWQVDEIQIMQSLQEWHKLFGTEDANERIDFERDADQVDMSKLDDPKIGKIDPDNTPHVGGNQWMGGTGGYNTAGLGGVGGPFRLDAGHDVHQIHESAKQQVSDEYLKKAREINRAEYHKRLKEIDMTEHDAAQYEAVRGKIDSYVTRMKAVIDSLEAREQERQWMKHQTSGDLDDGKLIEGMTGEKAIFRRRMDQPPEPGTTQTKPKRLRLVFDVSGSMYRFNGHDRRLVRSMEAAMMVMDALDGKGEKVKYDIIGHSGDGPEHVFTKADTPPSNEKQKFDVVRKMYLQSQFCMSGDFTVEALEHAIASVAKESDVDERFVVILSDANLDRYGISPRHLARVIESEPTVNAFVILIGSLGQQAERLVKGLPAGKAFYAADTSQLPTIIQNIFASTLIK
uniref:von Willebrand factor A domain-containing protein 8 n=1 Tax=Panagrellus redivivus TaxID=6233 RepID=A0A7E4ZTR3_PANRE